MEVEYAFLDGKACGRISGEEVKKEELAERR